MTQFWATNPVPADWQTDLDRLCPGENVSRLVLHWLPGTKTEPVQRWAIWEVMPESAVTKILEQERVLGIADSLIARLWKACHGEDPRRLGYWSKGVWRTKSLVSREQWDISHQTNGLPFLCWIVEGPRGGHAWQCSPFEQGFLLAAGVGPEDVQALQEAWPNPGSQAYAPYDRRVFEALAERDQLRQWREALNWTERSNRTQAGLIVDAEATVRKEEMWRRVMRWLDNQIGDAVSDLPRSSLPQWSDFQTVSE